MINQCGRAAAGHPTDPNLKLRLAHSRTTATRRVEDLTSNLELRTGGRGAGAPGYRAEAGGPGVPGYPSNL